MREKDQGRILAVDDNRVNRLVLEKRLSQEGFRVDLASDGHEALERLGMGSEQQAGEPVPKTIYDAVVLDIMMPVIDGITVLQKIREKKSPNELPVIMATAKDRSEDIVDALEQGCNDYVVKPIDMPVLLARLRTQVSLRRTYLALKETQRALIDAAKMEAVGYLVAGVAHEVRNPLAQIQMGVEILVGNETLMNDPDQACTLGILTKAVSKMDSIVRALMDISHEEKLDLKPGSINELVKTAVATVAVSAEAAGIECDLDLDKSMPSVALAAHEMDRILSTVLLNAIEASPKGSRVTARTRATIHEGTGAVTDSRSGMRLRSRDEVVVIEVTDAGPGVPPKKLEAIFDPFYTTKAPGQGTGLGLSLARKLVELHHGAISAANRENSTGLRVSIVLPTSKAMRTSV